MITIWSVGKLRAEENIKGWNRWNPVEMEEYNVIESLISFHFYT